MSFPMADPADATGRWRAVFAVEGDRDLFDPTTRDIFTNAGVPTGSWCRVVYSVEPGPADGPYEAHPIDEERGEP